MSCEFVSCEVLLNSRDQRDLYVTNCCAADMSRQAFVDHLKRFFPSERELQDKMLISWWKMTGESSARKRWRPARTDKEFYYRLMSSREARESYVQSLGGMPEDDFVVHLHWFFPSSHQKVLRDRVG